MNRYDAMAANNGEPAHEIDARRFWYLLEVLPPADWTRGDDFECFRVIEAQTGNLYTWAARLDGRHYEMIAPGNATPGEILAKVYTCQRVTGDLYRQGYEAGIADFEVVKCNP